MSLDTQMTLAQLQELLMALRANDADGYKSWLALGIEQLGRDVAGEVESDWMVPLLVEEERDRLMAWQLEVSPKVQQENFNSARWRLRFPMRSSSIPSYEIICYGSLS